MSQRSKHITALFSELDRARAQSAIVSYVVMPHFDNPNTPLQRVIIELHEKTAAKTKNELQEYIARTYRVRELWLNYSEDMLCVVYDEREQTLT